MVKDVKRSVEGTQHGNACGWEVKVYMMNE